jgi:hypothetical protein
MEVSVSEERSRIDGVSRAAWPALIGGLASNGLALVCQLGFGWDLVGLVGLGLLATGAAVAIRPSNWAVLATAAVSGALSAGAIGPRWDSAQLMILFLSGVAAAAAVLVVLPRLVRHIVISLAILFHFGGIFTAVTTVPPIPWITAQMWTYIYRPYLEFMYLSNAYHFYAPEPGPPTLIWAYVKYEDGSGQWVKLPRRQDYPLAVEYQRRLSLTESVNQLLPPNGAPAEVRSRRLEGWTQHGIPGHPSMAENMQYREPTIYSKRMLESYSRYLARITPHHDDPSIKVKSVKIYRVIHALLTQKELADGRDPTRLTTYVPYYQGEFDVDGKLLDPNDPCLYWVVPILEANALATQKGAVFVPGIGHGRGDSEEGVLDFLTKHAERSDDSP